MSDLTVQQELFCQYLAIGMSQYAAYKSAFNVNYSKGAICVDACRLANNPKVILRLSELKKELADLKLWERADAMVKLIDIIENDNSLDKDKIAAIKEANNLCGFYAKESKDDDNEALKEKILNKIFNEQ